MELPVLTDEWIVTNCEFVNLRKTANFSAQSLAKVYSGSKVKLLEWNGRFAKVKYNGKTGYILGNYLAPDDGAYLRAALDTVTVTDVYTYDEMMEDLIAFDLKYPELVELEIIGQSYLGVDIPVIRLGNTNADKHVMLQGGIHGREHATTWLLMALIDFWLDQDPTSYADVCFHIIPMVNPDGIAISQTGKLPASLQAVYQSDLKNGYTTLSQKEYAEQWKANGRGVDLNRNFAADWASITQRTGPSSEQYRGTAPFSEPETQMLRDYTHRYDFDATLSYHATGSIIYYEYGKDKKVNALSESLGKAVYQVTGYFLVGNEGVDCAGYKDWAIDVEKIPSLTVEIGSQGVPLKSRELYALFMRNRDVFAAVAQWVTR